MKRSGWASSKWTVMLENFMSAVMTTMSGSSAAIAAITLPATNDCDSCAIPARSQLLPPGTGATFTPSRSATLIDLRQRRRRIVGVEVADVPGARQLHI